ncbi:hypothetical protein K7432_012789 [Basidiobolus ranarum]|uniref:Uncharacterized protein n=1 Tax=Basidiobolus ranarum TaxID=34480 RepID=A0ABR2VSN1_9FUNG
MKFQLSTVILGCTALVAAQQPTAIPSDLQNVIQSAIENGVPSIDSASLMSKVSSIIGTDFASVTSQIPSGAASLSSQIDSASSRFSSQIASVTSRLSSEIASASSAIASASSTASISSSNSVVTASPSKSSPLSPSANTNAPAGSDANMLSMSGLSLVVAFVCTLWN